MVKEVSISQEIPGYTPKLFFDAIYRGNECTQRFHREVNNVDDAQLSAWEQGQRVVTYTMALDAPAFIKRVIGVDNAKVTETQTVTFHEDANITLSSVPVPNIPGGDKFTSRVQTEICGGGSGSCLVKATVTCTAAGPYGLTSTIEGFMVETARTSLQQWMGFTTRFLAEAAVLRVEGAEEGAGEEFFDAEDVPVVPAVAAAAAAMAGIAAGVDSMPSTTSQPALPPLQPLDLATSSPLAFEDAVLLYLRYQCRTGDQSCAALHALDSRVQTLEREVRALRTALVPPRDGGGAAGDQRDSGGRHGAAWVSGGGQPLRQHAQQLPRGAGLVSFRKALLGAAMLATASAAATALYVTRRHRLQSL